MGYLSFKFVALVVISAFVFWSIPSYKWTVLLVSSIVFYLSYDKRYFLILLISIFISYFAALLISKYRSISKIILICYALITGFVWFLMKYYNGISEIINNALNMNDICLKIQTIDILVPVGVSYYLLTSSSYLVDVYRNRIKPESNIFKYMLYVMWFPAIIQGPISTYQQLSTELFKKKTLKYDTFIKAVWLLLFGIVKKMVIADNIAVYANYCFDNYNDLGGFTLYLGAITYALQLYMDFSGCVDICRGVSFLFDIKLINNFNSPYFSKTIKEFWGRWHISLSNWLKEYIYIPCGGNKKGEIRKYINIFITFTVSAIWHGVGLKFLIWGWLHAIYQISGDILNRLHLREKIKQIVKIEEKSLNDNIISTVVTFHLVTIAWIFFRSKSFLAAIKYIVNMISIFNPWVLFDGSLFTYGVEFNTFICLFVNIFFVLLCDYANYKKSYWISKSINSLHIVLRWMLFYILIFDILLFGAYGSGFDASAFLYGGF